MSDVVEFVQSELSALADPEKARPMAAYLKTDMPFYGVPKPGRRGISRALKARFSPQTSTEYRSMVEVLWGLPHREEKYLAIDVAQAYPAFITSQHLDLYRFMVVDGAWWDLVDSVASNLIGKVLLDERDLLRPILDEWIEGDDMWLRRTAIISQLGHKNQTDSSMLFDYCAKRAFEKEFFIRKAIGWALRQYAKTDPDAVAAFLVEHRNELSGLSFREASKHLAIR